MDVSSLLGHFGIGPLASVDRAIQSTSPIDGAVIGSVDSETSTGLERAIGKSVAAARLWRQVPAPVRGELVRRLGQRLRDNKAELGALVTAEAGKITQEGLGEVQEMIDICDFATGLSRQLYGLTIASERPMHVMREVWHPLGPTLVITAFNFPVAVWSWNAALSLVCGNSVIWKPSEKTPLVASATQALFEQVANDFDDAPDGLSQVCHGGREVGEQLVASSHIRLVSATGSTRMGAEVGEVAAGRFAKTILELGGNNAMVVAASADLDLTLRAVVFSAVGTAGQRCTTLRRLIVHESIYDELVGMVKTSYGQLSIGDPTQNDTLVGPLIDRDSYAHMQAALERAEAEGGQVFGGQRVLADQFEDGYYVAPAIVEMASQTPITCSETFAPILYVMSYTDLSEAIEMNNGVPQGLSSSIFTGDVREAELFISAVGSDCGIANVNIGPSGAEIGGAFGGEKETGGGRESGSDSWKGYMRRQTCTVNYSSELPLAQGVSFEVTSS